MNGTLMEIFAGLGFVASASLVGLALGELEFRRRQRVLMRKNPHYAAWVRAGRR